MERMSIFKGSMKALRKLFDTYWYMKDWEWNYSGILNQDKTEKREGQMTLKEQKIFVREQSLKTY